MVLLYLVSARMLGCGWPLKSAASDEDATADATM